MDIDTCRICRGEGTAEEPLFYPCKCSGSIKYVHQECLMEWLSHSQKKHCELCKTPFRFTKLYHPDMPQKLPLHIFASHMTKYIFRKALVWLRAVMVFSVWLGWLPYLMRCFWFFLFWVSDEGVSNSFFARPVPRSTYEFSSTQIDGHAVCPSTPLLAGLGWCVAQGGSPQGFTVGAPRSVSSVLFHFAAVSLGLAEKRPDVGNSVVQWTYRNSLLSDVAFLKNATRHPIVNQILMEILEGQIITVLVIVSFILIILVRDYVVQQQPEINMRAAFAAAENAAQQPAAEAQPAPPIEQNAVAPLRIPVEIHRDQPQPGGLDLQDEMVNDPLEHVEDATAPAERPSSHYRRPGFVPRYTNQNLPSASSSAAGGVEQIAVPSESTIQANGPRDAFREYAMGDLSRGGESTVHEYLTIYREAGGDPERILQLVHERQLDEKLDYWIRLTKSMMDRPKSATSEGGTPSQDRPVTFTSDGDDRPRSMGEFAEWAEQRRRRQLDAESDSGKGKNKETIFEEDNATSANTMTNGNGQFDSLTDATDTLERLTRLQAGLSMDVPSLRHSEDLTEQLLSALEDDDGPVSEAAATGDTADSHLLTESDTIDMAPPFYEPEMPLAPPDPPHDTNVVRPAPAQEDRQVRPAALADRLAEFMWQDVDAIDPAELMGPNAVDLFGDDEDEFLDDAPDDEALRVDAERDEEVAEAAAAVGLDPEAIEDAEDLEGIMELLGMHGPIAGLFQNAIFCGFLVSVTIFVGVFVPYNVGRVSFVTLANPARLVRILFSVSKFLQDCFLACFSSLLWVVSYLADTFSQKLGLSMGAGLPTILDFSKDTSISAGKRVLNAFVFLETLLLDIPMMYHPDEIRNFSALSHESLLTLRSGIASSFKALAHPLLLTASGNASIPWTVATATNASVAAWQSLSGAAATLSSPSPWVLNLTLPESITPVDLALAHWNGQDRFYAVLGGYGSFFLAAALYLRRGSPFSAGQTAQDWEASIIDGLNQASGVMKVILIIGIEMLIFPLYCGVLLDIALLPLFENTTLSSRVAFSLNYPLTAIFVHWFVGTGYMFHFALFVSMCRKTMRKGVLYFIRDPDDPEFHPVRDVLERSVTTQLRKILFSAFVYGTLVMVCLGGVVWGLALALPNVLPIHYSSNEPVLEFPIDLLFYNFLMPLAVKYLKPSDGLRAMYTWWFRKCARGLRITWFLFGDRKIDEEGTLTLRPGSSNQELPWWKTLFLELNSEDRTVPKTWKDTFEGGTAKPNSTVDHEEVAALGVRKVNLVSSHQLQPDGRFVRTPASDQVKIPKGGRVFLEVTQQNERLDGKLDNADTDLYSSNQYRFVYVPPFFRFRIFLFIMLIWMFAAVTGIGFTIVPLVFGRYIFKTAIPSHIKTNDIYAFSIGIYLLGSIAYALVRVRQLVAALRARVNSALAVTDAQELARKVSRVAWHAATLIYAYFFLLVVFPLLVASLMEVYAMIPLHTYMNRTASRAPVPERGLAHTVPIIQAWTIGLLYLKLSARAVTSWLPGTRLAAAVRAVLRHGWLQPDVAILTRAFIVPAVAIWLSAICVPLLAARFSLANGLALSLARTFGSSLASAASQPPSDKFVVMVYRLSFPAMALVLVALWTLWNLLDVIHSLQARIRDEAYLIGERLHNFGASYSGLGAKESRRGQSRVL